MSATLDSNPSGGRAPLDRRDSRVARSVRKRAFIPRSTGRRSLAERRREPGKEAARRNLTDPAAGLAAASGRRCSESAC